MAANSRFAVAVHTLALLAYEGAHCDEGSPTCGFITSDEIADSVCTNAVVIRRTLRLLHAARLVECQPGKSGGSRLARKPSKITLLDVYLAVQQPEDCLFGMPEKPENKKCRISCELKPVLADVFTMAEKAVEETLRGVTLEKLVGRLSNS